MRFPTSKKFPKPTASRSREPLRAWTASLNEIREGYVSPSILRELRRYHHPVQTYRRAQIVRVGEEIENEMGDRPHRRLWRLWRDGVFEWEEDWT